MTLERLTDQAAWVRSLTILSDDARVVPAALSYVSKQEYRGQAETLIASLLEQLAGAEQLIADLRADIAFRDMALTAIRALAAPEGRDVFVEVRAERQAQDVEWGGPSHDDGHGDREWASFVNEHAGRAISATSQRDARYQWIRVAALAVAAAERYDRMNALAAKEGT